MSVLGIGYHYEPEAYQVATGGYLPDFYLPTQDCFVEIKPTEPTGEQIAKCTELAKITGKRVFILFGPPGDGEFATATRKWDRHLVCCPDGAVDDSYAWCDCAECGFCEITFSGLIERIGCNCVKSGPQVDSGRIQSAYSEATSYKFHG